mgnify:CR=1 FL=1
MQSVDGCERGSSAAGRSQILILPIYTIEFRKKKVCLIENIPSYAPETIRFESKRIHRTSSSCPSSTRRQAPHSISQT